MEFELKKVDTIGGVTSKSVSASTQNLTITVGVVGCPYNDIVVTKRVAYDFLNSLTVSEAKDGILTFATQWVEDNYPNT